MSMFSSGCAKLKKIVSQLTYYSGITIFFYLVLPACTKDPDSIGRDLLPASDNIVVKIDSTSLINSYTISGKRIITSANESYALGSLKDSIFGLSSASILTQFHPFELKSADSLRTVDSLILYLAPLSYYGDTLSRMTIRVYELNKKLNKDTSYFSDINPAEYYNTSSELASSTFTPGDTLIRIKITDPGIINKFETLPDSVFKDLDDFDSTFYGLYITVDQVTDKGGYCYLNMASLETRLAMYYNGDTLSYLYEMGFSTIAAKANVFFHDYAGFPVAANLNLPGASDSLMYIEGLAGTSGRLSFPNLDHWKYKFPIAINKAELILPVDRMAYPSLSEVNYPSDLLLFSIGKEDSYSYLYDNRVDQTGDYYDGSFDTTLNAYVFNIGLHLQSYINGKIENSELVIVSRKSHSTANRVILKGSNSLNSPVKLKVIYTELF